MFIFESNYTVDTGNRHVCGEIVLLALLAPSQVQALIVQLKEKYGDQELNIKITGRTCDLGDEAYNEFLSKQRAYSVMDMLMMKGLNINYVEVDGVGEEDPIVPNTSIENRKKNRSVSVMVVAGGLDQYLAAL